MAEEKNERCPLLRAKAEGLYYCEETERPSGRIQCCPREYGGECEEYNNITGEEKTIGDVLVDAAQHFKKGLTVRPQ